MDKETATRLNSEVKQRTGEAGLNSILILSACACSNEMTKSIESNIPKEIKNKIELDLREIREKWKKRDIDSRTFKILLDIAGENALRTFLKEVA